MKLKSLALIAASSLLASQQALAFFCPNNFNQVQIGDSIESVEAACGKPAKISKKDPPDNTPQEWSYFVPQSGLSNNANPNRATIKTIISFDGTGKAANITMNNISTGSARLCGTNIKVGMSRQDVESACGKPGFVNKQAQPKAQTEEKENDANKIIEYLYTSTPPVTLIFEKGKLTGKR